MGYSYVFNKSEMFLLLIYTYLYFSPLQLCMKLVFSIKLVIVKPFFCPLIEIAMNAIILPEPYFNLLIHDSICKDIKCEKLKENSIDKKMA